MPDKPLERAELELLNVIAQFGDIDRDSLSVEARGKGLEVGRPLVRLKEMGLVEEHEHRPFFLSRMFGAKVVMKLRLSAAAQALLAPAPPEDPAPAPETPEPAALPEAASAPDAEPEIAPEPAPVEAPPAAPVRAAAPKAPKVSVSVFTEDLGGTPSDDTPTLGAEVDPEVLAGMRELLEGFGMEMTMAGEALAADRMARGASVGEALTQVVMFTFAHAVRYDVQSEGEVQALGLNDYAIEVMREIEKLRDAGVIGEERFEQDMHRLWDLVQGGEERLARAEEMLLDPVGGAAPPALLPEDLRRAEEG
ncbi:hypothetical protein LZA78_09995 [Sinirhodobacter sp. WL0062]|uniref:DUF3102 domain-containing protein n=1 Tax=Rhodobacter flavimaris TaxID=2907145 RepID=A0ABS8YZF8_9RHOB|nr:hypothetical protein [Sinirhodobacter sp. WL0062]MCE5973811.1 hypothetical protein [Sinirhodobacter sp. WL0062]